MLDRVGVEPQDRRNLVFVVGIMVIVMAAMAEGPPMVRVVTGVIGGVISGLVFIVTTLVLRQILYSQV